MIVQLDEIAFDGAAADGWVIQSLSGWYDVPEVRAGLDDRPSADGSFEPSVVRRRSLSFTLAATYLGGSEVQALQAAHLLRSSLSGRTVVATVTDALGTSSRRVQVRQIPVPDHHGREEIAVKVDMIAFDPFRYGPESCWSTGLPVPGSGAVWPAGPDGAGTAGGYVDWGTPGTPGRVTVTNTGSAPAYPVLTVSGGGFSSSGFQIAEVESGRRLTFVREVVDGSVLRFDGRSRRVSIDGVSDVTGALANAEWPVIPAGGSRSFQFLSLGASSGAPSLQVCVAPAFL